MAKRNSSSTRNNRPDQSNRATRNSRVSGNSRPTTPSPQTWDELVIRQLLPWQRELAGVLMFVASVVTLIGLLGLTGSGLINAWTHFWSQLVGWGAFPLFLLVAFTGIYIVFHRVEGVRFFRPGQVIGLELILLALLPVSHLLFGEGLVGALEGRGGGVVGWALSEPLLDFLGPLLIVPLFIAMFIIGLSLLIRIGWSDVISWLNRSSIQLQLWSNELEADVASRQAARLESTTTGRSAEPHHRRSEPVPDEQDDLIIIEDSATPARSRTARRNQQLPPFTILEEGAPVAMSTEEIDAKKQIIEGTLLDFGLPALVTEIRRGPSVTQFGVLPGYVEKAGPDGRPKRYKVRVNQIASLHKDLSLALEVPRLRIEAPVPGRGIVGVEVPNAETSIVRLKPILQSDTFRRKRSPLKVALGQDVAGIPVATDLGRLPHLLIAGTTGSGKSVCLNALIACLAFSNLPVDLKMVMIDPKKVELIRFNGMPHLLGRVEVDADRVIGVLRWLTTEMDRRYELFSAVGARQLDHFNQIAASRPDLDKLPYLVIFIDELADLMNINPGDVERTLCRLAQMARATGMHLVVATQRPSTDVITGLIKANFPARASFAVASGTDSRVILDSVGAEHLLGKGDMLFLAPDSSAPVRIQGCFVSDREVESIVSHWQDQEEDTQEQEAPWEKFIVRDNFVSQRDDMLEDAITLAQKVDKISTSLIQRRLRVGYPRAARLMEALYEMGMVEDPKEGGRTRRTYVNEDEDPLDDYLG